MPSASRSRPGRSSRPRLPCRSEHKTGTRLQQAAQAEFPGSALDRVTAVRNDRSLDIYRRSARLTRAFTREGYRNMSRRFWVVGGIVAVVAVGAARVAGMAAWYTSTHTGA